MITFLVTFKCLDNYCTSSVSPKRFNAGGADGIKFKE